MLKSLPKRSRQFIVSLRFSILSIFSVLFLILLALLISIFQVHISAIIERASFLLMSESSYAALTEFNLELIPIESLAIFSTRNIRQYVFDVNDQSTTIAYLVHLLKENDLAQSDFWCDRDGNYINIKKAPNRQYAAEIIDRKNPQSPLYYTVTLDEKHKEISRVQLTNLIDPRESQWYKLAASQNRAVWTSFYSDHNFVGLAVSSPAIDDQGVFRGVFGIEVTLDSLSAFVAKQKLTAHSEFYILDPNGKIIAASDTDKNLENISISPAAAQAFSIYQQGEIKHFKSKFNGIHYLAMFANIPILADSGWMIGIVIPEMDFVHKVKRLEGLYLFLDCIVFLIGLVLMSYVVSRITHPINRLVDETKRIKNFDLHETPEIRSHIREVIEISDSIADMKTGLRSFKRYVPASLVRQLIESGEGVEVGGTKKPLAIFFSDIENFTTLAEHANENELTQQICSYFESISQIIIQESGTIDKYIGDSVMAFWGAPSKVQDPCQAAARSALIVENKLNKVNLTAKQANQLNFKTRIGIHYGEAIVGNIGSSERLNYTVLGDTVNIASRLVDVNKIYGTSILVSDTVYEVLKDEFILRLVDHVFLKGKAESTAIYELLADRYTHLDFNIEDYRNEFNEAYLAYQEQRWKTAIELFKQCLVIHPADSIAKVFIARCERFMENPPEHWVGIWRIN